MLSTASGRYARGTVDRGTTHQTQGLDVEYSIGRCARSTVNREPLIGLKDLTLSTASGRYARGTVHKGTTHQGAASGCARGTVSKSSVDE